MKLVFRAIISLSFILGAFYAQANQVQSLVSEAQALYNQLSENNLNVIHSNSFVSESDLGASEETFKKVRQLGVKIQRYFNTNTSEDHLVTVSADLNALVLIYFKTLKQAAKYQVRSQLFKNGEVQKLPVDYVSQIKKSWSVEVPLMSFTYVFRDASLIPQDVQVTPVDQGTSEKSYVKLGLNTEFAVSTITNVLVAGSSPEKTYLTATKCSLGIFTLTRYLRALEVVGELDNLKKMDFKSFCLGLDPNDFVEILRDVTKGGDQVDHRDMLARTVLIDSVSQVTDVFDKSLLEAMSQKSIIEPVTGVVDYFFQDPSYLLLFPEALIQLNSQDRKFEKYTSEFVVEAVKKYETGGELEISQHVINDRFLTQQQLDGFLAEMDSSLESLSRNGDDFFLNLFQKPFVKEALWSLMQDKYLNRIPELMSKDEFSKRLARLESYFTRKYLEQTIAYYPIPMSYLFEGEMNNVKAQMLYDVISVAKFHALSQVAQMVIGASVNPKAFQNTPLDMLTTSFAQEESANVEALDPEALALKLQQTTQEFLLSSWSAMQTQLKSDLVNNGTQVNWLRSWINRAHADYKDGEKDYINDLRGQIVKAAFEVKRLMVPNKDIKEMIYDPNFLVAALKKAYLKKGVSVSESVNQDLTQVLMVKGEEVNNEFTAFYNQKRKLEELISKETNKANNAVLQLIYRHLGYSFPKPVDSINHKLELDGQNYGLLEEWRNFFSSSEIEQIVADYKQAADRHLPYEDMAMYLALRQFYQLKGWYFSERAMNWMDLVMTQQAQAVAGGNISSFEMQQKKLEEVLTFIEEQSPGVRQWYEKIDTKVENVQEDKNLSLWSRLTQKAKDVFASGSTEFSDLSIKDKADYFLVKKMQRHMGFQFSQQPGSLYDVERQETAELGYEKQPLLKEFEKDFSAAQIEAFISYYRLVLKQTRMSAFHILDVPVQAQDGKEYPLYYYLGVSDHENITEGMQRSFDLAANVTIQNISKLLHKISAAKGVEDLSEFIIESNVVNMQFGETKEKSLLSALHITPENVGSRDNNYDQSAQISFLKYHQKMQQKMRASHLLQDSRVNSMLAAYHSPVMGHMGQMAIQAIFSGVMGLFGDNTPQVQDLFNNSSMQPEHHTPVIGMLEIAILKRFLPNQLGGTFFRNITARSPFLQRVFPNAQYGAGHLLNRFVDANRYVTSGYWKLFWGVWGGHVAYQYFVSKPMIEEQLESQKALYFTEVASLGENSLITASQLLKREAETKNYSKMITDQVKWGSLFLILPAVSLVASKVTWIGESLQKVGAKFRWANEMRRRGLEGNSKAQQEELKRLIIAKDIKNTKRMMTYFNDLKLPYHTWAPDKIVSAYKAILNSDKATKVEITRAHFAYRKLILHLYREFTPIVRAKTETTKRYYQLAYFKKESESFLQFIINEGERLILTGGRI